MAGVIPVIFASSLLYIPQLISQLNGNSTSGLQLWVTNKAGAAARVEPALDVRVLDRQRHLLLPREDDLVLRPVILEHAVDVLHA